MPPKKHRIHPEQGGLIRPNSYDIGAENLARETAGEFFPPSAPAPTPKPDGVKQPVHPLDIPTAEIIPGTYQELKDRPSQLRKLVKALGNYSTANSRFGYHTRLTTSPAFYQEELDAYKTKQRRDAEESGTIPKSDSRLERQFNEYVKALPAAVDEFDRTARWYYDEATAHDYDKLRASGAFDEREINDEQMIAAEEFDRTFRPPDVHKRRSHPGMSPKQKARNKLRSQTIDKAKAALEEYDSRVVPDK